MAGQVRRRAGGEEGGARRHRLEDAGLFFDPEIAGDAAAVGHQPDECLGPVDVELVDDEHRRRLWVACHTHGVRL